MRQKHRLHSSQRKAKSEGLNLIGAMRKELPDLRRPSGCPKPRTRSNKTAARGRRIVAVEPHQKNRKKSCHEMSGSCGYTCRSKQRLPLRASQAKRTKQRTPTIGLGRLSSFSPARALFCTWAPLTARTPCAKARGAASSPPPHGPCGPIGTPIRSVAESGIPRDRGRQ